MLEEAIPSIWASVYSFFTPTVLFVLLNVVIGTIAVTSKGIRSHHDGEGGAEHAKLGRTSSAVLDRLRSFNFYRHIPVETAPPPLALSSSTATLEIPPPSEPAEHHQFNRSQSDAQPTAGEMPPKLAGKMKKSASSQSAFAHFEESNIVHRSPAPAEQQAEEEEEVDARADDFINRFRQQLKLQRLESLLRYKEMLQRGR